MQNPSDLDQVLCRYMACQNFGDLCQFIETTPEAWSFDFHRIIAGNLQPWIGEDISQEARVAMEMRATDFFHILAEYILAKNDNEREADELWQRRIAIEKIELSKEQRIKNILTHVDEDLKQVDSLSDLARVTTRLVLNLISAETFQPTTENFNSDASEIASSQERLAGITTRLMLNIVRNDEVEKEFLQIWQPIVTNLLQTGIFAAEENWSRITQLLQERNLEASTIFLENWRNRILSREWKELVLHSSCKASLHLVFCPACHGYSWAEFWNVVHRSNSKLSSALAKGEINQWTCTFCKHLPTKRLGIPPTAFPLSDYAGTLFIPNYLDSPLLYRSVYYHDPEYGSIFRTPDSITSRQSENDKVLEMHSKVMWVAAHRDFPPIHKENTLMSVGVAYSDEEFRGMIGRWEEMHNGVRKFSSSSNLSDPSNVYRQLFIPLAHCVRNGEFSLEEAEKRVFEIFNHFPHIWNKGIVSLIEKDDLADSSDAIMFTLFAAMNTAAGFLEAAAMCLMSAAVQSAAVGRWGESLSFLERMEKLFKEDTSEIPEILRAQTENLRANLCFLLGDLEKALTHTLKSLDIHKKELIAAQKSEDKALICEAALNYASDLSTYGIRFALQNGLDEAYEALNKSLKLCEDIEENNQNIEDDDDYTRALRIKSGALNNLGLLMFEFIDWGQFLAKLSILSQLEEGVLSENEREKAWLKQLEEFSAWKQVKPDVCFKNINAFTKRFLETSNKVGEKIIWGDEIFNEIGNRALNYFHQAYEISSSQNANRFATMQAMNIAKCYQNHSNYEQAMYYCELSEKHAREANYTEGLIQCLHVCSNVLIHQNRLLEAKDKLKSAYLEWAKLRRYLVLDKLRIVSASQVEPILERIPKVLNKDQPDEWISILETVKSASLDDALLYKPIRLAEMLPNDPDIQELTVLERQMEGLKSQKVIHDLMWLTEQEALDFEATVIINSAEATNSTFEELQSLYDAKLQKVLLQHPNFSRWFADTEVKFLNVAESLSHIKSEVAFLGLWIDRDELLIYGSSPNAEPSSYFAFRIPFLKRLREEGALEYKDINKFVIDYRSKLFELGNDPDNLPEFQQQFAGPLFRALWQPIETKLGEVTQILISGHQSLHSVPWGTLWDGHSYLIERYAFSQILSLNVMLSLDNQSSSFKEPSVLALGDPSIGDPRLALPFTRNEIEAIAEIVSDVGGSCQSFFGQDANEANFFKNSIGKDIVHLACHAHFDALNPWESRFLLSQNPEQDYGQLTMRAITERLNLEETRLVVLSACESGLAQVQMGDEILGFPRSFHLAGVPNVLASLWSIDDESTQLLMKCVYHHLLHGQQTVANSLRLAQLDLIHYASNLDARNPFVWGSFVLYGGVS